MPEKLLSIKEVAEYLRLSEEEVKRLVEAGEIPAYRIGGTFLRFRREQIDAVKAEISEVEKGEIRMEPAVEGVIIPREPAGGGYDYTPGERIRDFFYFNDFYILSVLVIVILLFLIFKG